MTKTNSSLGTLVIQNVPKEYEQRVEEEKQFFEATDGKNDLKYGFLFHRYVNEGILAKNEEMMNACVEGAKRLRDEE